MGFRFNTDLLTDEEDRAEAAKAYPNVFFALDNPELRELFAPVDREANKTKTWSRRVGMGAVLAVAGALWVASAATWIDQLPGRWPDLIIGLGASAGVVGGIIGAFDILVSTYRSSWLEKRYLTERMRQLHFQSLIVWAPEIVKAAESKDTGAFLQARDALLDSFKRNHVGPAAAKVGMLTGDEAESEVWLVKPLTGDPRFEGPHAEELLRALEDLRLTHQFNYAELKLTADISFFSSPWRQVEFFGRVAFWAVVSMLVLDMAALIAALRGEVGALKTMGTIDAYALMLAILALLMRALEEGFQSRREMERFRQYRSSLRLVRRHFQEGKTPADKLRALTEMEEIFYEDMVNFLKGTREAHFVM